MVTVIYESVCREFNYLATAAKDASMSGFPGEVEVSPGCVQAAKAPGGTCRSGPRLGVAGSLGRSIGPKNPIIVRCSGPCWPGVSTGTSQRF